MKQEYSRKEYSADKQKYWRKKATSAWTLSIFEKRRENQSCNHDIARIWQPEGKIDRELTNVIAQRINKLREQGKVKFIKKQGCKDLKKNHAFYRLRLPYERPDTMNEVIKPYRKKKRTEQPEPVAKKTVRTVKDTKLADRVYKSNMSNADKIACLKLVWGV
jgi:hypothetical protein